MGFLRDLGGFAGKAAGTIVGGAVNIVGDVTNSQFINEIGDSVKRASEFAGDTVGQVADGAWNTASGIIQDDNKKIDQGLNDIGDSIGRTARGVYETGKNTYHNGKDVYNGFKYEDDDKIKSGLKNITKTVAVGALAVGVIDVVDGVNVDNSEINNQNFANGGNEEESIISQEVQPHASQLEVAPAITEQSDTHFVEPHEVSGYLRSDGTYVEGYYRDGDGNSDTTLTEEQGGGYYRSNPDENPNNNLNP